MSFRVEEIANLVGGTIAGNRKLVLSGVSSLELAQPGELSFVVSANRFEAAERSNAGCTIDRATFGSTVIKQGTKIDDQVHIAHNVKVGEHSLMAGQVGVADNAIIKDHTVLGGQAGVISGQSIGPGVFWGLPARPIEETKRNVAAVGLIGKLRERIHHLEERLKTLEEALKKESRLGSHG